MGQTSFRSLAELSASLEQTTKRLEQAQLLARFLHTLAPEEIPAGVRLIIGQVFPEWDSRSLSVSWKAVMRVLEDLTDAQRSQLDEIFEEAVDGGEVAQLLLERARREPPTLPPLTLLEVYRTFEEIAEAAGPGSRARKAALLESMLTRATPEEAKVLVKVIYGEMRHGVSEGVMLQGVARAAGLKAGVVRRANQLWGDIGEVARVALTEGHASLRKATLRLFRPVKPMLAQTATDLVGAFAQYEGELALEYKLDGARVQVHRQGDRVRIYSRNLADVTASLPDVVAAVRHGLAADEAILEGEAVAQDAAGRPLPFQDLMRRFQRKRGVATAADEIPVHLYLFDALQVRGVSLVDEPNQARWAALEEAAGDVRLVRRLLPQRLEEGMQFAEAAHRAGHEGIMAKDLHSPYSPGVRGKSWLKLKRVMSLDLVVVAAEWGYGRRHGWLSNYHLAARDSSTGSYRVVGKTFKGLTDAQFEEMTARLLALEKERRRGAVIVQPHVVVEVLFNEIQASDHYPSGLALRFARISRIRDDKDAVEADTIQTVQQLYEEQFRYKGQLEAAP